MGLIIRNISVGIIVIDDLGIELVSPGDEYDLAQDAPQNIAISTDLPPYVASAALAVLDPLDDTTPLSPAEGLVAVANANAPNYRIFGGKLEQLEDVDLTGIVDGQALAWSSGNELVPSNIVTTVDGQSGAINLGSTYASVAQGNVADTAVQPGDNISGLTNDAGFITIGDVPADAVASVDGRTGVITLGDLYATFAQGATADTATQPGDNVSDLTNDAGYLTNINSESIDDLSDVNTSTVATDQVLQYNGTTWVTVDPSAIGGSGSFQLQWRFDTATTSTDPGNKKFKYNSAVSSSVTEIYFNDTTESGVDATTLLSALDTGDKAYIQQTDDAGTATLFTVVSSVDNGSWFTVTVTVDSDSGLNPNQNKGCGVVLIYGLNSTALQPGDNVSELVNDENYTSTGDNVSLFVNDAGYITIGDVPAALVTSVFGRTGIVTALAADYAAFYATTAQGALADSALQTGDNVSELVNDAGYITLAQVPADAVTSVDGRTGVVTLGDLYATTAQGTLADSSTQPGDDNSTLTNDSNFITIGDVPAALVTSVDGRQGVVTLDDLYATFAQGTTADSAVQPADSVSVLTNDAGYITLAQVPADLVTSVAGKQGVVTLVKADITDFSDGDYATAAQGVTADSATQPGDDVSDLVNDANYTSTGDNVSVFTNDAGYITLAQVPSDAVDSVFGRTGVVVALSTDYSAFYATTAQGTLADSSVQPGDDVSDLVNDAGYITIGDVPAAPVTSVDGRTGVVTLDDLYATFAQGATADTAVQPGDDVSDLNNDANYTSTGDNISVFVNDAGYITSAPVDSVFGRTGAVVAQAGDYSAFYATTAQGTLADSAVQPGDNVSDLVNDAGYITSAPVDSVFGRTGAVVAVDGDYDIDELGDVTITSPSSGDILEWNGTAFVNVPNSPSAIGDLSACQARRSTLYNDVPLTWTDLNFDVTDFENNSAVIEHIAPDEIEVKEAGTYEVYYFLSCDDEIQGRVRINDSTVIPGSNQVSGDPNDANNVITPLSVKVYVSLAANDVLTVQIQTNTNAENLQTEALFSVKKLEGAQGPQGIPGVGSSVLIADEGINLGAFTNLNFTGLGVTATDAGTGTTDITIPGVGTKSLFLAHNGATVQTLTTTAVTSLYPTNIRSDAIYSYSAGVVTVNKTGWFKVTSDFTSTSTGSRSNGEQQLVFNGTPVTGTFAYTYNRNSAQGRNTASVTWLFNVTSGDTISVNIREQSGTVLTLANSCRLLIEEVDGP